VTVQTNKLTVAEGTDVPVSGAADERRVVGHASRRRDSKWTAVGLIVLAAFVIVPFLWMLLGSFKPSDDLLRNQSGTLFNSHFTLQNYRNLFGQYNFAQFFLNSTLVAVVTAAFSTSISAFAGYALARYKFPGRGIAGFLILVTQMLPLIAVLIPLFIWFKRFDLIDTYWSLFVAYNAFAIPFCTWTLRGFFAALPVELEEAAKMDGAGDLAIFFRIVLPISSTGLVAASIFSFILAWQEFLFAVTFISTGSKFTLTVGIAGMFGKSVVDWGLLDAGVVVSTIPIALLFSYLQRFLVRGLTAGAVKG
jgi:ABC-type glycerol-3-phosphate transport system permease component